MIFGIPIWKFIVEFYIVFVCVLFLFKVVTSHKKFMSLGILYLILFIVYKVVAYYEIAISAEILKYVITWFPLVIVIILAPEIRRSLDLIWKKEHRISFLVGSDQTKQSIVDATFDLASHKIGALITIEKHNTLDQYAERAIMMNSDVTKEVLINIFTPLTPLHDGAVIIRGDKILCAGAYFVLSENETYDKTMGSRHRAGLGISEVTDSLTILVSEETGDVSIAVEGILLKMNDHEKLSEYINMFLK
ncbi:MAG: diadenylate cyclase [Acholeplasmataceae bacterium]